MVHLVLLCLTVKIDWKLKKRSNREVSMCEDILLLLHYILCQVSL